MKFHPDCEKVREVIAAFRAYSNENMSAPGYGPDWLKRIKSDVAKYLKTGEKPFYMERAVPAE